MHLLLALADIAGIVPLPFLSIPISHAIGNLHNATSVSVS